MHRGTQGISISLLNLMLLPAVCADSSVISAPLLQRVASVAEAGEVQRIVDTRLLQQCRQTSLDGAVCLPVEDLLAPHDRLANWSGILWLLGTAGLSGTEHVLVIGEQPRRREFIAGVLLLAGQRSIRLLETPVSDLLQSRAQASTQTRAGSLRATTRTQVFTEPMRSDLIVLRSELETLLKDDTLVLDGRSESEYYGVSIRAARGGHIPGAVHSPLGEWRRQSAQLAAIYRSNKPLVYAHNAFDTLVYLTALHASGVPARAYLPGWTEWAFASELPADSVSYANSARKTVRHSGAAAVPQHQRQPRESAFSFFILLFAALVCGLVLLWAGYRLGLRRARRTA